MHCAQCGFVFDRLGRDQISDRIRRVAPTYAAPLRISPIADLRARPAVDVWSPLEYACHVRDVLVVQRGRLDLIQDELNPDLPPMGREERVMRDRYNEQEPLVVAEDLSAAARLLADRFDDLDDDGWSRRGTYHWPTPTSRSVEWIGRQTVHEGEHHFEDLRRGLDHANRGSRP